MGQNTTIDRKRLMSDGEVIRKRDVIRRRKGADMPDTGGQPLEETYEEVPEREPHTDDLSDVNYSGNDQSGASYIGATPSTEQQPPEPQQIGRIQEYWIATMKIYADCAVQADQEGVFDVLARNFETPGALSWWLWRIGHADNCQYTKRKDIVDAIRKVAALLHKELRRDVGRPVARQ